MNDFFVSITKPGTKKYPIHQHPYWEVMYYLSGEGYLATENRNIPFKAGSIIVVPPKTPHGSVSKDGFVNISIGGNFNHLFLFPDIVVEQDNSALDGKRLASLIFDNKHTQKEYLSALCNAYAHFLINNSVVENRMAATIRNIIEKVTTNFFDPNFDITALLKQSGYAEDYIRAEFKKVTDLTPIDFLTKIRISHAQKMFEIYSGDTSVSLVAEACGFNDPIYFSRRFKDFVGISPTNYKKQIYKK